MKHTQSTKNGRRQLKVKCASCGITKTRFIKGGTRGGALSSRRGPSTVDKIAYVASNFVTPAPSFAAAAKILGSQALKGVTDNVNYFRRGGGDYDMRNYAGNRVDDPTNPLYERGVNPTPQSPVLICIKLLVSCLNQRKGGRFLATITRDRTIPLINSCLTTPKPERY